MMFFLFLLLFELFSFLHVFFLLRSMGENCTKIKIVLIDVMYV